MNLYRLVNAETGEVVRFVAAPSDGAAIAAALGDGWVIIETAVFDPEHMRDIARRAILEVRHEQGMPRIESRIIIPAPGPAPTPAPRHESRLGEFADELAAGFFELVSGEEPDEEGEEPW